jgi:outer membrane receptor for ferrienterochelin and colicins
MELKTKHLIIAMFLVIVTICNCFGQPLLIPDSTEKEIYNLTLAQLMNIRVDVASKVTESVNEAPGVVSVITAREIESFGATSLRDVLERVTGTVGLTGFAHRNVISMRGDQNQPGSGHILVMINGRPFRNGLVGEGDETAIFSMYPLDCIEQIEIVRGPGSVLYGSNAFSGVINIVTKSKDEYFSASASGASPMAVLSSVSGAKILGEGILSGGLYYKNLQDWNQFLVLESGIDTSFNTHEEGIGINLSYNLNDFTINTALLLDDDFNIAPKFGGNYTLSNKYFLDAAYTIHFTKNIETTFNATNSYSYKKGYPLHPKSSANDIIAEVTTKFRPNIKTNIVAGGLLNYISGTTYQMIKNEEVHVIPAYNQLRYSFYSQIDYKLFNTLKAIGGFQLYKYQKEISPKLIPRIGLIYQPIESIFIKALYAQAYRSPSANETTVNSQALVGNPNLKPESVNSFDLQFIYNSPKFNSSLTFFLNKQFDIIRRYSIGRAQGYENGGKFAAKGFEIEMKYIPTSKLFFTGSATYQTNMLNDSIKNFTTSPITAKLGVSYISDYNFSFGIFNILNSIPPDVVLKSPKRQLVNPVPHAINLLSLNVDYNLSEALKLTNVGLKLNLRVDNLLDEDIYNAEWNRSIINSIPGKPGRRIFIGVKINI